MPEIAVANSDSSRHVLVVGAGVSGLTTALCLRREGMEVTIVAEKFAPHITSVVAGALWEWPPAVCGYHQNHVSLTRSKGWSKTSYDIFAELARNSETGVFMRTATFYLRHPAEEDQRHYQKMNELRDHVRDFVHDSSLITRNSVNPQSGVRDAYSHLTPLVDTDAYMTWLLGEVHRTRCRVIQQRITGILREQEEALKRLFEVDAIVNCAGLGSAELANEYMYPLRGALVRILNNGKRFPRITQAHCVAHEGDAKRAGLHFHRPTRQRHARSWWSRGARPMGIGYRASQLRPHSEDVSALHRLPTDPQERGTRSDRARARGIAPVSSAECTP